MQVHINYTRYSDVDLSKHYCPTCDKQTFFTAFFQDYYGWDSTCLKCGEHWCDGEMSERPFARGWRKDSIKRAKAAYRSWSKQLTA
jgi:hypothetical protein